METLKWLRLIFGNSFIVNLAILCLTLEEKMGVKVSLLNFVLKIKAHYIVNPVFISSNLHKPQGLNKIF